MITAINYWSMKGGSDRRISKALTDVKTAGFQGLELVVGLTGAITTETSQAACRDIRRQIDASGLIVETVATDLAWDFSPTHIDPAVRQRALALQRAAIERTGWLGCKDLLLVPGAVTIPWDPAYPPVPYADALKWATEAVATLLPTARDAGVALCIENVWNGLLYSPLEMAAFVDQFAGEVGVYLDVGNLLGLQQWPPHWIDHLAGRIRRVHVKDYSLKRGGLDGFCDLNHGDVPWPDTIAALRRIGYDSTLVAECGGGSEFGLLTTRLAMDTILGKDPLGLGR